MDMIQGKKVKLPTKYGNFSLIPFQETRTGAEHMVLIKGELNINANPLVRIHSSCATGDLFGSLRCDCGKQLERALVLVQAQDCGAIVYLQQEGRGIGLMEKIHAYKLQEEGMDTVDANLHLGFAPDERNYKMAAEILHAINIAKLRLLTNNPEKVNEIVACGINVTERIPLIIKANKYNEMYLHIKQYRMGHLLGEQVTNLNKVKC